MPISDKKRLATNTLYMYIRMLFLMLISFYSSRILLKELGVEDFGIYNLVGSIVAMFISFKGLFASATQRFISYELGNSNDENINKVYHLSLIISGIISILFLILSECVGCWFIENKINVDPSRINAVYWLLHLTVLATIIGIMSTPYDAMIIAHERMGFYSVVSVIDGVLRLIIIPFIGLTHIDKLIFYAFLLVIVTIIIRLVNIYYCKKEFYDWQGAFRWDKDYFYKIFSFSGWNCLGFTSYTITQTGLNMILNVFGGPIVNAARGVANQVNAAITQLLNNINVVVNPYIVKSYAENRLSRANQMFYFSAKVILGVQASLIIPIVLLADYILDFWLTEVPAYTAQFLVIILLNSIIRSIHGPIDTLFKAIGNLKYYQLAEGLLLLLPMPLAYFALEIGCSFSSVFIVWGLVDLINLIVIVFILNRLFNINIRRFVLTVMVPMVLYIAIIIIFYYLSKYFFQGNMFYDVLISTFGFLIIIIIVWLFSLDSKERTNIVSLIRERGNG